MYVIEPHTGNFSILPKYFSLYLLSLVAKIDFLHFGKLSSPTSSLALQLEKKQNQDIITALIKNDLVP